MTRACPCRLDRSPLISPAIHRFLRPNGVRCSNLRHQPAVGAATPRCHPVRTHAWHQAPTGSASDRRGKRLSIHMDTRLVGLRQSLVSNMTNSFYLDGTLIAGMAE